MKCNIFRLCKNILFMCLKNSSKMFRFATKSNSFHHEKNYIYCKNLYYIFINN